jgi:tRNA1Val (adenine37-N6)-methyltransferase
MPETSFKFKQFEIRQDKCAMKVGTDGVLIGAWAKVEAAKTILDIGSGTGLIALMIAQRNPDAYITAIDINKEAYLQARENVENSTFKDRISMIHSSLQEFDEGNKKRFDLIVSNPPYFSNAFKPENLARAYARHTDSLSFNDFFSYSSILLKEGGSINLIVPFDIEKEVIQEAEKYSFKPVRSCKVFPKPGKSAKRMMFEFLRNEAAHVINPKQEELIIELEERHQYSEQYIALTREFYLNF